MIAACSQKTAPVGPKFKGRLLLLSGDAATGKDLLELTAGPNDTFNYTTLTSGVIEAAASPDQTQLLYATKDDIRLRDLGTGRVKPLIKGQGYCLAWSPDSKRFSYKQRNESSIKLFASDLEGNPKLVWEERLPDNQAANQSSASDMAGCAHWIAPDKLIFDRFGPSQKKGGDVKPNTTTLATVSDSVKLVDAEKKWSVEGICKTGSAFLRSQDQGQLLIAKSLENLKAVNPASGPCSVCRFVGFAAQSCVPFFIEENTRDSSDLFSLNPTNWQRQRAAHIGQPFSLTAKMLINSSTRLMVIGDAPSSLWLVDTESGDITSLVSKSGGASGGAGQLLNPVPIVWIEK
jgi:WD40 repeat protein